MTKAKIYQPREHRRNPLERKIYETPIHTFMIDEIVKSVLAAANAPPAITIIITPNVKKIYEMMESDAGSLAGGFGFIARLILTK
jgi:hypothetical protein